MGIWRDFFVGEESPQERAEPTPSEEPIAIPSRDAAPLAVSTSDALSLANVYRAVTILGTAVTQLSLDAWRGEEILEPVPSFIRKPNINSTREAFLEETQNSLALNGNAYWLITRDNQGRVQNLEVLNPLDVIPQATRSGRVTGYQYAGREKPYSPAEVQHLKFLRVPGSVEGLGAIQAAQRELRGSIDLRDYSANWFRASGTPSGILKTDQHLNQDQAKEAEAQWNSKSGGTRVIGNGLDYKSIYLSPRDAQFLENRAFSTLEIARLFGIPASLMLANIEGSSQTYSNISQAWVEFSKFTISRYTKEIEAAFTELLPRGTKALFNFEAFLRPDVVTRYEMHQKAISSGWMTPNEVRKVEDLPPIPGGDELVKPSAPKTKEADNA